VLCRKYAPYLRVLYCSRNDHRYYYVDVFDLSGLAAITINEKDLIHNMAYN